MSKGENQDILGDRTVADYRNVCQKGSEENYILDKYIYRPVSIFGTMLFLRLGISSNATTAASLIAMLGSLWFFTQNTPLLLLIGVALVLTYHVLDHMDGEMARYYIKSGKMKPSLKGQFFDVLCHSYSINMLFICTGFALYKLLGYEWAFFLGLISMAGSSKFPSSVATRILMMKVANDPDCLGRPEMKEPLKYAQRKGRQIAGVNAPIFSKEWSIKFAKELNGYPGILTLFLIACVLDAFIGTFTVAGYIVNFRLLLLFVTTSSRLIYPPYQAYRWMQMFAKIS